MDDQTKTIIGYIGGTLLNITFIPQIYKTFKTKKQMIFQYILWLHN